MVPVITMLESNYNTQSQGNLADNIVIFILKITYHLNLSKSNQTLFFDECGKLVYWDKPLFKVVLW